MITSQLGSSAVNVTTLGLGTAQLGDLYESIDQAHATAIVDTAWNAGIRYFDTAPHYGLGLAERRLGVALATRERSQYVLSSKVGRIIEPDATGNPTRRWDFSAPGVRRSIDESLARLRLDRIDIALIHDPGEHLHEALDEAYPALEQLRRDGIVGAIGVGTGNLHALTEFAKSTNIDTMMIAGRYTLLEQPVMAEVVPACVAAGISILNAGVFNSGLLATANPTATSHYEYGAVPAELLARAQQISALAERAGSSLPQAALKFASRNPAVASVVIGADTSRQLRTNVNLFTDQRPMDGLWAQLEAAHLIAA